MIYSILSQYIISHKTIKSQCVKLLNFKENSKVVEITKDTAMFIRENEPNTCIVKTMSGHTSKRGKYYVEDSRTVSTLLSEYKKSEKIIEEYPVSK